MNTRGPLICAGSVALLLGLWIAAGASSLKPLGPSQPGQACVFPSQYGQGFEPCAPFATVRATVLATFPATVFGGDLVYNRRPYIALPDGSAMVAAGLGGLFRIDRKNRASVIWKPSQNDYWFSNPIELLAPFNDGVVLYAAKSVIGVRKDGSVAFRKQVNPTEDNGGGENVTATQDPDGTVWIAHRNGTDRSVYAYVPRIHRVEHVPTDIAQGALIASFNGRAYENTPDGLFELGSVPTFRKRFVRKPITSPSPPPGQFGMDGRSSLLDIQAVGSDGSLWASTWTQVIHMHPDGSIHVIRLAPPITAIHMQPINFDLTVAHDGSVWIASKPLRITNDDRVQVIDLPDNDGWRRLSFSPDNSVWTMLDGENVAHFSIVPSHQAPFVSTQEAQPLPGYVPARTDRVAAALHRQGVK